MTYINKGRTIKVIYCIFNIIPKNRGDAFKTVWPKQNRHLGQSQPAPRPNELLSHRHLGDIVPCPTDVLLVCSSLVASFMLNRLFSTRYHLSSSSKVWMLMCHYEVSFVGMHFGNTCQANEWKLMLLAALEWAHREGWLILSFYTIHLQSTWLSAFFLNGQFVASLLDLLEASMLWLQNTSRAAYESDRRPLNAVCDPVTVYTDSCQPTAHCQK